MDVNVVRRVHCGRIVVGGVFLLCVASAGFAQVKDIPASFAPPGQISLETGTHSPAGTPEHWLSLGSHRVVQDVSVPTLTPFLPAPGKATGTAVVVAPGGAFLMLSMDTEGWSVARYLQAHGIAAFVLKYRLLPTTPGAAGLQTGLVKLFNPATSKAEMAQGIELATEDAKDAMRVVRARAREWNIDPHRVGFMGFSAGAFTALSLIYRSDAATRPDFVAVIYGPMGAPEGAVPASPPPLWAALASDDPLLGKTDFALLNAWRSKGGDVEFHLYDRGGHGFGFPGKAGTTTMHWGEEFIWWLGAQGLLEVGK